jgi:hypothetical protein
MTEETLKRKISYERIFYCWKGGKIHKAYYHSNIGAGIIWCPKHGVLASETMTRKKGSRKQMTKKQYEKFVGD